MIIFKNQRWKIFSGLTWLGLAGIVAASAWAQGTSLRGQVTDEQESVIVGATVTVTAAGTGVSHQTKTLSTGDYEFLQISPGAYTLTVEMQGFAVRRVQGVQLLVDSPATLNVTLSVAQSAQAINVEAIAAQLNTVNASVGNAFQEVQVQALPIQTRNIVDLLSLQPGVVNTGEVLGARRDQNNVTLDGIDINDNQNGLSGLNGTTTGTGFNAAIPVPLDSVMEFRVTVAGQGADQGRSSGGQVSVVTRSGSNSLHGSAYEFNRNTDFTANTFFNNLYGLPRPQLVRNQFGASLGGPVKKNRLFYFLNYERRIDASQSSQSQTVPSDTLKSGNVLVGLSDGTTYRLTPQDIQQIDPLHIGVSQSMLKYLNQFPSGNAPALGADNGLNFTGFRFNTPATVDTRAYVGKFDYIVDSQARHTVSFRGTLSNSGQTVSPAQFPGQSAASTLLSDNRGFGIRYTWLIRPTLINVVNLGLTRVGFGQTGVSGDGLTLGAPGFVSPLYNYMARASSRINPTWNVNDDLTWVRSSHTVSGGINFRFINNTLASYANSFPAYSNSSNFLIGLGADIQNDVLSYIQTASGKPGITLSNPNAVVNAMADALGLIDRVIVNYQTLKDGSTLALGQPQVTDFITRNWEAYVQDTWKVTRNFTLTYGLRYSYVTPPYEATGLQVGATPPLNEYFANRVYAQSQGIPANQFPLLSYSLNGPVNGKASWFGPDTNNFGPRLSFAYSPGGQGLLKWMGKDTVIRGGAAITYDQYGNDLVTNYASLGSIGLSTQLGFPASYNFTTSPRLGSDGSLPALPAAPSGGFPYTPADVGCICGTFYGISPDLSAPYSYLLNFSVSHQFSKSITLDVGYVGRLSHKLLIQQDIMSPLIYFKDPKGGGTLVQTNTIMRNLFNGGLKPSQVQANPGLVPLNSFVEDMFPGLKNRYIPGSATANYFYGIYGVFGGPSPNGPGGYGSDLDFLSALDRSGAPNGCISITGCWTFFAPQGSAMPTWTNAGRASYHGLIVTLRRALSNGFAFDFNYTWSHAIDNGSIAGDGTTQFGGVLQNAFMPNEFRGSSDFDIRHQVNANVLYQLPFGKGKRFLSSADRWVDGIVGAWEVSSLMRFQTGTPSTISAEAVYPTNYWQASLAVPWGSTSPRTGVCNNSNGLPDLFCVANPTSFYQPEFPGQTGTRAIVRLPGSENIDVAVSKAFRLPWEGHSLTFRAEAFNLFNHVNFNFTNPATGLTEIGSSILTGGPLSLAQPGIFGQFSNTAPPRVMQLSLRYSF